MDVLKLIPQVFFDLIARAIPGALLLVGLDSTASTQIVQKLLVLAAPNSKLQQSSLVWVVVVGTAVYATGHMMSAPVRLLESPDRRTTKLSFLIRQVLPFRSTHEKLPKERWEQYDWLRLEKPDVGGLVARIRAEYTMYGGFAIALWLTATVLVRVVSDASSRREHLIGAVALLLLGVLMHKRQLDTYKTFGRSVENFCKVAKGLGAVVSEDLSTSR